MLLDLRIAARALRSWGWGAVLAVLTLAVGIGMTTALYALLRVALADSAVEIDGIDRLVRVYGYDPAAGVRRAPVTLDDFDATLAHARTLERTAAYRAVEMTAGSGPEADVVSVMHVSKAFFDVLGARPLEGRLFTPADARDGEPVAIVSERTWRGRLAGRRIVDGATIRLNGREHAVVGVLPASFSFPSIGIGADAWIPLSRPDLDERARVMVIARLAPDVSWGAAAAELSTLAPPLQQEGTWRWVGIPVQQDTRARTGGATAWIFFPAAVVLIIGCVNVACMLLARGMQRDTELSVRMALGAGRGAVFRQLFLENVLLALGAAAIGIPLAFAGLDVVARTIVSMKPELSPQLGADAGLLPIALTVTAVACLLFGLLPAARLSRRDVASSLKGSAPLVRVKVAGYSARDLVVFVELALASVLVVMTAIAFAVVSVLQDTRIEFAAEELLAVGVPARDAAAAMERVRAVGGVTGVALASTVLGARGTSATISAPGGRTAAVSTIGVSHGLFETVGFAIVRGRSFRPDETAAAAVAVVTEGAAAALWPGEDPIGRSMDVTVRGRSTRTAVIGMTRDPIRLAVARPQTPEIYLPLHAPADASVMLLARSPRAKEVTRQVADAARPRDAVGPVEIRVLAEAAGFVTGNGVKVVRLFGAFTLIALLLAGSGIFAVVGQSVNQRTTEFGVRLALGATPARVLRTVLAREFKLIAAALATGTIGTMALTRSSGFDDAAFMVAVSVNRPEWGLALIGLCGTVAVAACVLATRRIVTLDPSVVLRRL